MSSTSYQSVLEESPTGGDSNPFLNNSSTLPHIFRNVQPVYDDTAKAESSGRAAKRTRRDSSGTYYASLSYSTPAVLTTPFTGERFTFTPRTNFTTRTSFTAETQDLQTEKCHNELLEARKKIMALERDISTKEFKFKSELRKIETEKANQKIKLQEIELEKERLKQDNEFLCEQEKRATESRRAVEEAKWQIQEELLREKSQLYEQIRTLEQKCNDLEYTKEQAEKDTTRKVLDLERKVSDLERLLNHANSQLEAQERVSNSRQWLLTKTQEQLSEKEKMLSRYSISASQVEAVESVRQKYEDQVKLTASLREQLRKERETNPVIVDLTLKNQSLRRKVEELSRLSEIAAKLQTEKAMLQQDQALWFDVLNKENLGSPYKVSEELRVSRIQIEGLRGQIQLYQEFMERRNSQIDTNEAKIRALIDECKKLKEKNEGFLALANQAKAALLSDAKKLWDALKNYNPQAAAATTAATTVATAAATATDTATAVVAATAATTPQVDATNWKAELVAIVKQMINTYIGIVESGLKKLASAADKETEDLLHFEPHLTTLKQENDELQKALSELKRENLELEIGMKTLREQKDVLEQSALKVQESIETSATRREELQKLTKELQNENEKLQSALTSLESQIVELEAQLNKREFNNQMRILELKDNPESQEFSIRKATLDALQTENKQLREKLKQLALPPQDGDNHVEVSLNENNDDQSTDLLSGVMPRQSFLNLEAENQRLQTLVADKEKMTMRLKEVWNKKAHDFGEAVYKLLGYRLTFIENGRCICLKSMYSQQEDHSFIFALDENNSGTMRLCGGGNTDHLSNLSDLIKFWVDERNSVPCFLSSVTLDLFERTTVGRSAGWVQGGGDDLDTTMAITNVIEDATNADGNSQ